MFTFCKPVSSRKRFLSHRKINNEFSFTLFDKASLLPANDWDALTHHHTIFLERKYLEIIEHAGHTRLTCRYVVVYFKHKPCGIIYYQVVDFNAGIFGDLMSKQVDNIRSTRKSLFAKYIDSNKEEILLRLFTCGNNLVSGEYGFLFDKKLKTEDAHELLLKITDLIAEEEKLSGGISAILLKDFHKPLLPKKLFTSEKYHDFFVEPNLVVDVPVGLHSIDDYVALFSKKYRNRAKGIFKAFEPVQIKSLEATEIKKNEKEIYRLYNNIFEKAKFKLVKLPPHYFSEVKSAFKERFTLKAFYAEQRLIGFASSFVMPDGTLEAHYIGCDYEFNAPYNLYQNILYQMIGEAISHKCKSVNLGRTAAEIKTTVGAKPVQLLCYIKPQNTISKIIQKPFISFLQPAEWIARNPFREDHADFKVKEKISNPGN